MTRTGRRTLTSLAVAIVAALLTWYLQGDGSTTSGSDSTSEPTATLTPSATPMSDPEQSPSDVPDATGDAGTDPESGLPWIEVFDLPQEGQDTLLLIKAGGPYPYPDRDDSVFSNREDLLPDHEDGYYREYTVPTPGSDDRGARRIVAGSNGEFYYTDDHYSSFRRIVQ